MNQVGILAIDQGTTSSRAIIFDKHSNIITTSQQEFEQIYPQSGWVEHDPEAIWHTTLQVCQQALQQAQNAKVNVEAIGITNQRETSILWDKTTGKPIYNAIVWQDRRTADYCDNLKAKGHLSQVQSKTGLLLDPYFCASKIRWLLDNIPEAQALAESGQLAFGTIDTFLIWRLTQGQVHATDTTNASRTLLFNIHTLDWDDELLELFNIPKAILPEIKQCTDDYGQTHPDLFGKSLPIAGVAGDQHAATIGQGCFEVGDIKSTYGTGCFVMQNTGEQPVFSKHKLLTTLAYTIKGQTHYALEGSIFIAGAAIQWLRDGLKIIDQASDTQALAESIDYDHGVVLVPAFTGLGAPYWSANCKGAIYGLTRATSPAHFARAALEAVCYQTHDLFTAMENDGVKAHQIKIDGGMVNNPWFCQFLADILKVTIERPDVLEKTALGAAYLAGLQVGIYPSLDSIKKNQTHITQFTPNMKDTIRNSLIVGWEQSIKSTLARYT